MATSAYEALFILPASYEDEQVNTSIEKYTKVISDRGGEIEHAAKWEKRKMAYEIKGTREGIYCLLLFKAEHSVPAELSRVFRISDEIIRARIFRRDEKPAKEA
jgi:small subunit ribosomal protein S6